MTNCVKYIFFYISDNNKKIYPYDENNELIKKINVLQLKNKKILQLQQKNNDELMEQINNIQFENKRLLMIHQDYKYLLAKEKNNKAQNFINKNIQSIKSKNNEENNNKIRRHTYFF